MIAVRTFLVARLSTGGFDCLRVSHVSLQGSKFLIALKELLSQMNDRLFRGLVC